MHLLRPAQHDPQPVLDEGDDEQRRPRALEESLSALLGHQALEDGLDCVLDRGDVPLQVLHGAEERREAVARLDHGLPLVALTLR